MNPLSHLKSVNRMAFNSKRNKFLHLERERLTRYQHQHRGLDFLKLWLPPITDRKVNIIGLNNHIYKGKLPVLPLDQLPPEVDPKSVDEEELYKEIRDMRFPIVPSLQSLGPARRIGGTYTTAKKLNFAPVQINLGHDHTEMPIIGADGKMYQGKTKAASVQELDRKLRGTNRQVKTPAMYRSDRGIVTPTVVSLYVDGKPPCERKPPIPLIQLPYADLDKLIKLMEIKTAEEEKEAPKSESPEEQPVEQEESPKPADEEELKPGDDEESMGETSMESISSGVSESSVASESSTTTVTEASSEATDLGSELEEALELVISEPPAEVSESEPEVSEAEVSESEPED